MSRISAHVTFYFKQQRLSYLISVVRNLLSYPWTVDIFICTNVLTDGLEASFKHLGLNVNPYKAFWICDQKLGEALINHYHWVLNNVEYYDPMAAAAIGLYSQYSDDMYLAVLPIHPKSHKFLSCCLCNHLPNNYVESDTEHGKLHIVDSLKA